MATGGGSFLWFIMSRGAGSSLWEFTVGRALFGTDLLAVLLPNLYLLALFGPLLLTIIGKERCGGCASLVCFSLRGPSLVYSSGGHSLISFELRRGDSPQMAFGVYWSEASLVEAH